MGRIKYLIVLSIVFSNLAIAQIDTSKQRSPTAIPNLFQVATNTENYYEDQTGQYHLTGILMDLGGNASGLGEDLSIEKVADNVKGKFGELQPDRIRKTPVTGIYELLFGKLVKYMDGSGRFLFRDAELIDNAGNNLTYAAMGDGAKSVAKKNLKLLQQIANDEMLNYPAQNEKHVLTVFTDTNCPYCRKFHKDINEYTKRGITVRYVFFPRAGVGSASYQTAVSIWCSDDPQETLSNVERGLQVSPARCNSPIDKHLAVAEQLNLLGTPVLMLEDGEMLYGYSHPNEVISKLTDGAFGLALN